MTLRMTGAVLADVERQEAGPVTLGYGGTIYQVVVSAQDHEVLAAILQRYLDVAEPIGTC